jgi:hypothetical protein
VSVVCAGRAYEIPGLATRSWLDPQGAPPRAPNVYTNVLTSPGAYAPSMVQPITGIVWHTVHGTATGEVLGPATCGTSAEAYAYAQSFARPMGPASTTFVIADNGLVLNLSDLCTDRAWGAGGWNPFTVSIEIDQHRAGGICAAAIAAAVDLAWWLSDYFGVQPMIPVMPDGTPDLGDIERLVGDGAKTWHGHFFHADSGARSSGDPGPAFGRAFLASGAEGFDARARQDIAVWKSRQAWLGMPPEQQDGVPGARTVARMREVLGRATWAVRAGSGGGGLLVPVTVALALWWAKRRKRRRA